MKEEHKIILNRIQEYLEKHPEQRFGQAIFNLRINEFKTPSNPKNPSYVLRDIYNDDDKEIIERINTQLEWFDLQRMVNSKISDSSAFSEMTVDERLESTGLLELYDKYKVSNIQFAKFILRSLKVDEDSINKILDKATES